MNAFQSNLHNLLCFVKNQQGAIVFFGWFYIKVSPGSQCVKKRFWEHIVNPIGNVDPLY